MIACGGGLLVSSVVEGQDLRRLLLGLRIERCAHSWRNFDPDGHLDQLVQWENTLRPTAIFFYYAQKDAQGAPCDPHIVAAATVVDCVHAQFPHAGFPVMARCYVLPEFRGRGLYRHIVQHRLEYCRARFGAALKAIHLGTRDERIAQALGKCGEGPQFVQLGSQMVKAGSDMCLVGAYVHLTASYAYDLAQALRADAESPSLNVLSQALTQMMSGAPGEHALALVQHYLEARSAGCFRDRDESSLLEMLDLCRAIPLVGFEAGRCP
jgi:GNAT superfamily N-acetyltransferase